MVFNSLTFAVFFMIVLVLHNLPLPWKVKKTQLLVASYLFYAAWNPPFILLLWASTVIDWLVANQIHRHQSERGRKAWLLVSLAVNFSFLGFFKYGPFALENFQLLMKAVGVDYQPAPWNILLPVGISFYTFHSLSYTLDIYWRRAEPIPKLADFALFVSFFTQLVAGPILRKADLVPQLETPRTSTARGLYQGLALMVLGLFEKVVLADGVFAPAADTVFGSTDPVGLLDGWIGALAFSGQIFCDFAGYSTIAIGAALCLGFHIPENFNSPYAAIGFSDFWRRWHISLSTWLRDYLYIPLGGNRQSEARTYRNLLITMLLGGLWHGANWTFVVWGGLHGLGLALERKLKQASSTLALPSGLWFKLLLAGITYALVTLAWVFFRAKTLAGAVAMLAGMIGLHGAAAPILSGMKITEVLLCSSALLALHWATRDPGHTTTLKAVPRPVAMALWVGMAFAVLITQGTGDAFIYFQF
jgi:D-alanyl-lipoteichoic acid acyltransferase DltB (MBOAT superfamily)